MKLVLGLDIGISSVGWGIVDIEKSSIVDCGVRLFSEGTAANNLVRRTRRSSRRLKSRKANRIKDLKKLLHKEGLMNDSFAYQNDPYEIRVRGLHETLTNDELCTALLHICKRRGNSLEVVEDDEAKQKDNLATKAILKENDRLLKSGLYVCEIQQKRLKEQGSMRGVNNNFRSADYLSEVKQLLKTQKVEEGIQNEIIDLIFRRRMYYEGPGSEKSPTPYGRFIIENGEVVKINLIEKMIGKCSIYEDQLRAPKKCYSADLFNLLNDLNNLQIDGEKITKEQKLGVIDIINEKGSITPKQLAKFLDVPFDVISGFRIDKKGNEELTKFDGYKEFKKVFESTDQLELQDDKDFIDEVAAILTKTKGVEERKECITQLGRDVSNSTLDALSGMTKITGYHSLSLKALRIMNRELLETELNQMQILQYSNLFDQHLKKSNQKGKQKIKFDSESAILSPVAKRAINEAIKVVNQVRRKYGELDSIVVETTREKNSAEQKKNITKSQNYFKERKNEVQKLVGEDKKISAKVAEKLRLYMDQDGKSMYTLQPLNLDAILHDANAYEVDHIIPISISFDDSINNKVLTTHWENQMKGNLTPVQAFRQNRFPGFSFDKYKAHINHLCETASVHSSFRNKKKRGYLLFEENITKFDVMKEFVNRNLIDTSYANRVVFNTLANYFSDNEIPTKIHTVKGKFTDIFRRKIDLPKDREENHSHHAIDALIIASLKNNKVIRETFESFRIENGLISHKETGLVQEIHDDEEVFDSKFIKFIKKLNQMNVVNYSYKVDKKPNRQISDETIYSTRKFDGKEMVVKKYKNIYDPKFFTLANDIVNNSYQDKYLMAKHDPQTFDKLIEIVKSYYEEFKSDDQRIKHTNKDIEFKENPFSVHFNVHGKVKKFTKKHTSPEITSVKYFDGNLGNHIPISKYYNVDIEKKNVVLLQISPYRTDFYKTKEGKYKFVTVRYNNVQFIDSTGKFTIDNNWYESEKKKNGIEEKDEFLFSIHRNEIIEIETRGKNGDVITERCKFTATNSDKDNRIETKPISHYEKKQMFVTIGKKTIGLRKLSTNVLGDLYEIKNQALQLEF